jgi:outer membrane protein assembly factor BamB
MIDLAELLNWQRALPGGKPGDGPSSPRIAGSRLIVRTASAVHCLDVNDGTVRWSCALDDFAFSSPFVSEGDVYVASMKTLFALRSEDGRVKWQFSPDEEHDFLDEAIPVASAGRLLVRDGFRTIYALDAQTGRQLWTFADDIKRTGSALVVAGDRVIAACHNVMEGARASSAVGIDVATGGLAWRIRPDESPIQSLQWDPEGTRIRTDRLWWMDASDGAILAYLTRRGEGARSAALDEETLLVLLRQEVLLAFKQPPKMYARADPGFYDRQALSYSLETGCLYQEMVGGCRIVDPATGEPLADLVYGGRRFGHPAVAGRRIYLQGDGEVVALRHPDVSPRR